MVRPGRPSAELDDYLFWQERLASREASGMSVDEFCAAEDGRLSIDNNVSERTLRHQAVGR